MAHPLTRSAPGRPRTGTGIRMLTPWLLGALMATPVACPAQTDDARAAIVQEAAAGRASYLPRFLDPAGARKSPEGGRKSAVGAAILGAYVPLAGYAYAGSWKRGIAPQTLWFAFAGGVTYASDCIDDTVEGCSSTRETIGALAWIAGAASVFWGGIGAYRTASAHNRAREERIRIEVQPGSGGGASVNLQVLLPR